MFYFLEKIKMLLNCMVVICCRLLSFVCFYFIDPEQAKLLLPVYERILSKQLRNVYTETRAHTIDDFMTGIKITFSIKKMPCLLLANLYTSCNSIYNHHTMKIQNIS